MDTENGNPKTGGLKLMTVFIVVLALHVLVIGDISAYHLFFKGDGGEMASSSLTQKDTKENVVDGALPTDPAAIPADAVASNTGSGPMVDTDPGPNIAVPLRPEDGATPSVAPTGTALLKPAAPVSGHTETPTPVTTPVKPTTPKTTAIKTPAPPIVTPAVEPTASTYTVKPGDSLFKIARTHGTSVKSLMAANKMKTTNLKIGQKLVITGGKAKIAKVSEPVSSPVSSPALVSATSEESVMSDSSAAMYTVVKGDTLAKIARHFKTTPKAIMTANNLSDPRKLAIGAKLKIPVQEARNQAAPAPAPVTPVSAPEAAPKTTVDLVMAK